MQSNRNFLPATKECRARRLPSRRGTSFAVATPLLALCFGLWVERAAHAAPQAGAAPLRLCADPTNPPFSSNKADNPGLYLELGAAIGQALGRDSTPVWQMTYYGQHAIKETLLAGKCDMMVGIPADAAFMGPRVLRSHPFLQVGFALVAPKDAPVPTLRGLHGKRVAVQLGTPPQSLLATHDDITMTTFVDPESAMQALADGKADAAFIWGPSAGYVNHAKLHDSYRVTPVRGEGMQYEVAVGFARGQTELRDQVNRVLATLGGTVAGLAAKYGFPAIPPVELSWASQASAIEPATFSRPMQAGIAPLPITRVTDTQVTTTDDQQGNADYAAPGRTAADTAFKPATGPTAAEEGRTIFNGTCNHCHGPDATTAVKKINLRLLQHRYGGAMDQVFHFTVTHGRESKGMPNWSGVFTEADFAKIVAFLHTVQETN